MIATPCRPRTLPSVAFTMLLALASFAQAIDGDAAPTTTTGRTGSSSSEEAIMDGEAKFDEVEALKKKAAQEGDWEQGKDEQVAVNERVLTKTWNKPPFNPQVFDYTPEQMKANWPRIMQLLRVPYPSPEYLRVRFREFPAFKASYPDFDGNFDKLSADVLEVWRLFFRGDYQDAMRAGNKLGFAGQIPGMVSQIMYAIYLEPNLADKHMLLQDAANVCRKIGQALDGMQKKKEFHDDYVIIRVGYSYGIARIAEDVPVPTAIARNYIFKVLDAANDVRRLAPEHPLGLVFRAGIDANVIRKVGKAAGRITFGARQTEIREFFVRALKTVPDAAVVRYEYANAIMYMDKKRKIAEALAQLNTAAGTKPQFSMEALDAMYAAKRRKEVEALNNWPGGFRAFERKRIKYQRQNNQNLYCVLPTVCPPFIVQ